MELLGRLRSLFAGAPTGSVPPAASATPPARLCDWYVITFDDHAVYLHAEPPGREPWSQQFAWDSVVRVCFEAEDFLASDGIYVFTTQRPESYAIPTEARGGQELWFEILRRKLFDASLAIKAATSTGGLYCWPPERSEA